jgi:hypothetical protein
VSRAKHEILRRLRLGDLRKLLRSRYGHTLPNDDAGREDLHELLLPISLGPEAVTLKMANAIEVWAPWMKGDEAGQLIDQINRTPARLRKPKALGKRLRVTNEQRERWKLWTIAPCDMTDAQMHEQRKAKKRARDRQQRQRQPRRIYLANAKTKNPPWKVEGISRRTWYRNRAKAGRDTGVRQGPGNGAGRGLN